ncbi:E3 SUMO-protein ligase pli1, partial [Coemansia sp. RSA 678]
MSSEDLEKIVFNDYGLLFPTANLVVPFICAESPLRLHSKAITAKLSEDQLDLLRSNVDDPGKGKYGIHLFISNYASFCIERRLNQNARARLFMPLELQIKVNGAYESNLLQPDMIGRPIDLTQLFQVTSEVANRVDINYISNAPLLAVLTLTVQHTPQSMAGKIRKTNFETIDKVRQQFFGKQSDDDDVIAEGALVNLKCPLGLCRIKVPCRSKQCQHSQCFDCATFLQFYNMTTGWKCPVCSVGIKSWNELIVDGYFEDILLKTSENDEQVFVEPNGDWKLKKDATIMGSIVGKISGRPLDVDEEEDPIDLSDSSDAGNQSSGRHKRRRTDFVDLTMDSDSDDAGEEELQSMTQEEIEMINALEADAGSAIGSSGTTTSASSQLTPHQAATPNVVARTSVVATPTIVSSTPVVATPTVVDSTPVTATPTVVATQPVVARTPVVATQSVVASTPVVASPSAIVHPAFVPSNAVPPTTGPMFSNGQGQ